MILTPLQERVLGVLAKVAERNGFAMGGGVALQALGVVARPTEDFDIYHPSIDPDVYTKVEQDLTQTLEAAGFKTSITKSMDWFRCIKVEDPENGESVKIDLGMMGRTRPVGRHPQVGDVLDIEDLRASKVDALVTRHAPRDYIDTYSIIQTGAWTVAEINEYVARFHSDAEQGQWKQVLASIATIPPSTFAEYEIDATELAKITKFFTAWAETIPSSTPAPVADVALALDAPAALADVRPPSTGYCLDEATTQRLTSENGTAGDDPAQYRWQPPAGPSMRL